MVIFFVCFELDLKRAGTKHQKQHSNGLAQVETNFDWALSVKKRSADLSVLDLSL